MIATDTKGKIQWFPNLPLPAPQTNDLTGATIDVAWVDRNGNATLGERANITIAVDGTYAIYVTRATDFPTPGSYDIQFKAMLQDGTGPLYSEMATIIVGRKVELAGW